MAAEGLFSKSSWYCHKQFDLRGRGLIQNTSCILLHYYIKQKKKNKTWLHTNYFWWCKQFCFCFLFCFVLFLFFSFFFFFFSCKKVVWRRNPRGIWEKKNESVFVCLFFWKGFLTGSICFNWDHYLPWLGIQLRLILGCRRGVKRALIIVIMVAHIPLLVRGGGVILHRSMRDRSQIFGGLMHKKNITKFFGPPSDLKKLQAPAFLPWKLWVN